MKVKITFGLAMLLIPAFFLVSQRLDDRNKLSDLRDAPNSISTSGQLQDFSSKEFNNAPSIPMPAAPVETRSNNSNSQTIIVLKSISATLEQRGSGTQGGRFYKNQCVWLEGYDKVKCIEHSFALDLTGNPENDAYYEEDNSSPYFRLTTKGKESVLANVSKQSKDPIGACLDNLAVNKGKTGPKVRINKRQAKHALSIMRELFEIQNEDALNQMRRNGCKIDRIEDIDNCWMEKHCPDIKRNVASR